MDKESSCEQQAVSRKEEADKKPGFGKDNSGVADYARANYKVH